MTFTTNCGKRTFLMQITQVSSSEEFGATEVEEIMRVSDQGVLRPLMCRCTDGQIYFVKPFNSGGWPLCLEWICGRLGRLLQMRIPNYRQVLLDPDLVAAWNETGKNLFVEPGIGFGSQLILNPAEVNEVALGTLNSTEKQRIVWFDWWIRNGDRRKGGNPNMVWSPGENLCFLIDHEKAGDGRDETEFWADHVLGSERGEIPEAFVEEMRATLSKHAEIRAELPSSWTSHADGLGWFFSHLQSSLSSENLGKWEKHDD